MPDDYYCRVYFSILLVIANTSGEEVRFLRVQRHSYLTFFTIHCFNVYSVDAVGPFFHDLKAWNEVDHRRFTTPESTHDG